MHKLVIATTALSLVFLTHNAQAFTLDPVQVESNASVGYCTDDCSSPYKSVFGIDSSIASIVSRGSNKTILSSSPSISSYAEAGFAAGETSAKQLLSEASGYARLVYDFEITGPQTIPIPVPFEAAATLKATGGTYISPIDVDGAHSDAYLYVLQDNGYGKAATRLVDKHETASYGIGDTGGIRTSGFSVNETLPLMTNTVYQVQMTVNSVAALELFQGATVIGGLTTEATIDPTITLDPAYSKDYTLVFSEGLVSGSVTPVPLPSTAPLLGAAVSVMGIVGYRRRRKGKLDA